MIAALPKIVRFLGVDDCPGASCPHCGCTGRYIHRFQVEGGARLGAMSGCVKLFPKHRIAIEEQRLRVKEARYVKQGWKLNKADAGALDAIEAFANGATTEAHALFVIKSAKASNTARFHRRVA